MMMYVDLEMCEGDEIKKSADEDTPDPTRTASGKELRRRRVRVSLSSKDPVGGVLRPIQQREESRRKSYSFRGFPHVCRPLLCFYERGSALAGELDWKNPTEAEHQKIDTSER